MTCFLATFLFSCTDGGTTSDNENDKSQDSTEIAEAINESLEMYEGLVGLSIEFLHRLEANLSTDEIKERYAKLNFERLEKELDTDDKKKAFWINSYNGFIQHILLKNPEYYEDRDEFFSKEQVEIAGINMSFDQIEHGIIRSSKWKLGAGYLPKISQEHVRKLKTDSTDGRIHLALNCGAKSCPPIATFHDDKINHELDIIAKQYLKKTTKFGGDAVIVTPLMNLFRGDFNGKSGIKKDYLFKYGLISDVKNTDIEFGDYDWSMDLGNYTKI